MTSWRTLRRRRENDLEFIEQVRAAATPEEVARLYANHVTAPAWKRVAIQRAAARVDAALAQRSGGG